MIKFYQTQVLYSNDTASKIDQEIIKILNFNYERVQKILEENWDKVEALAELLLKKNSSITFLSITNLLLYMFSTQ